MINRTKKLIFAGTSLLIIASLTGCSSAKKEDLSAIPTLVSPAKEEFKTVKVGKGTIERKSEIRGKIVPVVKMDMYFKGKGGYLTKLNVKSGDTVKKGDVIATLDDADIRFAIKQEDIKLKLAQLTYDQAVKNNASEFEQQRASLLLEAEKLQMEQLNGNLKSCTLTAGMSGKIIFTADVKLSQYINSFQTLATIADPNSFQIQCDTKNTDFPVGSKVKITLLLTNYDGEVVSNTAMEKKTEDDSKKNSDVIFVNFSQPPSSINLGDGVGVSCIAARKENVLVVPGKCIKFGAGNHPFVEVLQNGDIHERYIEIGIDNGTDTEIVSGLTEGEDVVTN